MFNLMRIASVSAVFCLLALASPTAAKPSLITIDYPGAQNTYLLGINPQGDIVGAFDDALGQHGFALRNGEYTALDWPGALWTNAYGINPKGDIVGQYGWYDLATQTYTTQGFFLRKGIFYPVEVAGQQNTMPFKINPDGMIVGCNHHNVTNQGGTDLNTMMGFSMYLSGDAEHTMTRSMNLGVNPAGDIVGYYFATPSGTPSNRAEWSYLIRKGEMSFFQFPDAYATLATDINARGTIIGRYRLLTPSTFHGFILDEGEFQSFDISGATQTFPFGISSTGDVAGYYIVGSGTTAVYHGFLLTTRGGRTPE
jgi:hypothetical protein